MELKGAARCRERISPPAAGSTGGSRPIAQGQLRASREFESTAACLGVGECKAAIACAALWMAAKTLDAIDALPGPNGALLCQFTRDETRPTARMQPGITEAPSDDASGAE